MATGKSRISVKKTVSSLPVDTRDRLENVQDNIRILLKQIKVGTTTGPVAQSTVAPVDAIAKLAHCAQAVSDGCTKLAVLFSKPPAPTVQECGVVCESVEQATLQLVATFYQLPPSQGRTFRSEVESAILRILTDLDKQVTAVIQHGSTRSSAKLQGTGTIWESCGAVTKLSRDNRSAAIKVLLPQLQLLRDALTEVKELEANNGRSEDDFEMEDDMLETMEELNASLQKSGLSEAGSVAQAETPPQGGDEWSQVEMAFIAPALKLIEVSTEVTKEFSTLLITHGDVSEKPLIEEVDTTVDLLKLLSPRVDDLASELPAPLDCETCRKLGCELGETLLRIISTLSKCHFCSKAGSKWEALAHKYQQTTRTAIDSFPSKTN